MYIFDSVQKTKREFIPQDGNRVSLYVCGPTVYDDAHLGHAKSALVFDLLTRVLKANGYDVTYARNITDIDDKIIKRAVERGITIRQLTDEMVEAMHQDITALGILPPDQEPRATEFVPQMLSIISQLQKNGLAYQSADGDVNYSVRLFKGYGKLSGKSLDELRAGERVAVGDGKRDPLDFVLWKSAKTEEPADTRWKSPWGEGRPGWHIECSAMSCDLLGEHFDIHGGGADLQFPHHENEIAQSEGALYGKDRKDDDAPFVNYWMHNGHIRVNEEKMSKSLGNFFLIRDVLKSFDPEVLRFFMLKAHYRSPINYSDAQLEEARSGLARLYTALAQAPKAQASALDPSNPWAKRFTDAMNDDFNTSEAIAVLFDLASEVNRAQGDEKQLLANTMKALGASLNFLQRDPTAFLQAGSKDQDGFSPAQIEEQIAARVAAKQAKDFAKADFIRKTLLEQGIVLEDKPGGLTEWRRA